MPSKYNQMWENDVSGAQLTRKKEWREDTSSTKKGLYTQTDIILISVLFVEYVFVFLSFAKYSFLLDLFLDVVLNCIKVIQNVISFATFQ